ESGGRRLGEDVQEQVDIAIDERQARLVWLAAQAGCDDDDVAIGDGFVSSCTDSLVGDQRRAVQEVERLAAGLIGVQVDEIDVASASAALKGECGRGADQTSAADDADFHV